MVLLLTDLSEYLSFHATDIQYLMIYQITLLAQVQSACHLPTMRFHLRLDGDITWSYGVPRLLRNYTRVLATSKSSQGIESQLWFFVWNRVWFSNNRVSLLQNTHRRMPIACPHHHGQAKGSILWVHVMIYGPHFHFPMMYAISWC